MSVPGQKAKNSLRANVFRCSSNNRPSWPGPSKALGEIRGLLLSLVGERFEPRANCSASYCARPFVFRTVLKLRSTKLWRKMSSPTANCRLFGNLQYGHSPGRSQFVGDFGAGRPRSIADCPSCRQPHSWSPTAAIRLRPAPVDLPTGL